MDKACLVSLNNSQSTQGNSIMFCSVQLGHGLGWWALCISVMWGHLDMWWHASQSGYFSGGVPSLWVWTGQGLMKRAFVFSPKQSSLREWGLSVSCQPRVKEKLKLLICSWSAIKVTVWDVSVLCLGFFFALALFNICLIWGKGTSSWEVFLIYAVEGPICGIDNRCSLGRIKMTLLWNVYANE